MPKRQAILLDRDGTLIVEKNYLSNPLEVEIMGDAVHALQRVIARGYAIVIISNQSGVGRGILTTDAVEAVNRGIADKLAAADITIAAWYYCPHKPDAKCHCRKPMPGLAIRASNELGLSLKRCWVIGDKASDIQLAQAIGAQSILVRTGYGANAEKWAKKNGIRAADDLNQAVDMIIASDEAEVHVETF